MSVREIRESPASEVFGRRIREERERRDWSQEHLADLMTAAGAPLTRDAVSKIERGKQKLLYDEAVAFAGVLEEPFVRLASPREGEEVVVRVDPWRPPLKTIDLRNWFVFGHSWMPTARGAQLMMKFAYAARDLLPSRPTARSAVSRDRLVELGEEIEREIKRDR